MTIQELEQEAMGIYGGILLRKGVQDTTAPSAWDIVYLAKQFAASQVERIETTPTRDGYPVRWGPIDEYINNFEKQKQVILKELE